MSETTYTYHGPPSGVTLRHDGADREILLFPRRSVTLPGHHAWTRAALARGHLVPKPAKGGGKGKRGGTRKPDGERAGDDSTSDSSQGDT